MVDLLHNRPHGCRVVSEHFSQLWKLRALEKRSKMQNAHLGALLTWLNLLRRVRWPFSTLRNAVDKVIDCFFNPVGCGSEGNLTFLSGVPHSHKFIDLLFLFLALRRSGLLPLFLLFLLPFFLLFAFLPLLLLFLLLLFLDLPLPLRFGDGVGCLYWTYYKVGVLDSYFFDSVVVVEGFFLEGKLYCICRYALQSLDFDFEGSHLSSDAITLSLGWASMGNTLPLRSLTISFISRK